MTPRVYATAILILFAQNAYADWSEGLTAFENGDYRTALQHFEAEERGGLDGPAVHYNIAVCNYQLNRFTKARESFQLIAYRYPKMRGLAEYNLGLVAQRSDDADSAIRHFLKAHQLSPDDKTVRVLSSNRLRELAPDMRSASKWAGAVSMNVGFDDNVALRDETGLPSTAATDSPYIDLFASIKGPYSSNSGFRVIASLYIVRNFDADEFDQAEVYGGAMYDWTPGDWRLQIGLHTSAGTLGDENFDRKSGIGFKAIRYLNNSAEFGLSYVYDDVQDADIRYAGIAGSRQQLQANYRWYSDGRRFSLRYRQEENNRLDELVSPKRKTLSVDYRFQPDSGWGYAGGFLYRVSRFDEMALPREEDLVTTDIALTYSFAGDWLMSIGYKYANNDSSDPVYSYDRNILKVGALKLF